MISNSIHSFLRLHNIIHPRATTEFIYRYSRPDRAHVFVSFILNSTSRTEEVSEVLAALEKEGMKAVDISDDELAKAHGRYLVGGLQDVENERVFRFGTFMRYLSIQIAYRV